MQPLCRILWVDQGKKEEAGDWAALKVFFCVKIEKIKLEYWNIAVQKIQ